MTKNIQAIRGVHDYLPKEVAIWQHVEDILKKILHNYGYSEIRLPILESTALFQRAIGELTDVVEKEMYTFNDYNGNSLTMRPEGTAGCVRASIAHSLMYENPELRLWYIGPMFRYERPQKGRYRQFHQLGVEVFGLTGPNIDAEIIMLTARWWKALGINGYLELKLNSIASSEARKHYRDALVIFLEKHKDKLNEDCRRKMYINPLRILDSKNLDIQALLDDAPILDDYIDEDSREHFSGLCNLLKEIGIPYTIDQRLVRGLDYYNRTVFEWVINNNLNTQKYAICAGGRYDGLVEQLGGCATPAIGFAIGLERLILLIKTINPDLKYSHSVIDIYLVNLGVSAQCTAMRLAEHIRDAFPNVKLIINQIGGSFRKQFAIANKLGAKLTLVLGESELATGNITVKDMCSGKQITVAQNGIVTYLNSLAL